MSMKGIAEKALRFGYLLKSLRISICCELLLFRKESLHHVTYPLNPLDIRLKV